MEINPNVNNFFDLNSLKEINTKDKDVALKEVAKQLESVFLQMVLKSMSDANDTMKSELFPRDREDFYQEMLNQQMALSLSKSGGVGLADVIVKQLQARKESLDDTLNAQKVAIQAAISRPPSSSIELSQPAQKLQRVKSTVPPATPVEPVKPLLVEAERPKSSIQTFIQQLLPHARKAAQTIGVDPMLLVAQSALETGWGKHMIRDEEGNSSHNLFGIKAPDTAENKSVLAKTTEYVDNIKYDMIDRFKKYTNLGESFNDYMRLISSDRYESARSNAINPRAYLQGLFQSGYATDPQYVDKVMAIYESKHFKDVI